MRKIMRYWGGIIVCSLVAVMLIKGNVSAAEVWDGKTIEAFTEGNGTKENPYEISKPSQLAYLAQMILTNGEDEHGKQGQYYELTADLDLGNYNWQPIGYAERQLGCFLGGNYFWGVFEGNGHTIKNLKIQQKNPNFDNYYYGLFGWNCGTIQNVKVESATIDSNGASYIGGIAAVNEGIIENCTFSGSVKAYNDVGNVGGIVGRQEGGTVDNCKNTADIIGKIKDDTDYIGGIVGYNEDGQILNCVNEGKVTGNDNVGGITGMNDGFQGKGVIKNCMNAGMIQGEYQIGGIAGENLRTAVLSNCGNVGAVNGIENVGGILGAMVVATEKGSVQNCVNTGKVSGDTNVLTVGAVVGQVKASMPEGVNIVKRCYYWKNSAQRAYEIGIGDGTNKISNVKALSAVELKKQSSFKGFDFTKVWKMSGNYPVIRNLDLGSKFGGTSGAKVKKMTCTATYKKAYGAKKFKLNVKNSEGTVTYKSSNKKVAKVSKNGYVTIKGTGYAKITITADNGTVYSKIYVAPKKVALSSARSTAKKTITVKWKKDTRATGYQIQISRSKKFTKILKTVIIKKTSITTGKIKGVSSKTKYYVRMRAYKTINNKKYYGEWSSIKAVIVK